MIIYISTLKKYKFKNYILNNQVIDKVFILELSNFNIIYNIYLNEIVLFKKDNTKIKSYIFYNQNQFDYIMTNILRKEKLKAIL